MSTAHSDMLSSMRSQLQLAGAPPAALAPLDAMAPRTCARSPCDLMRLVLGRVWGVCSVSRLGAVAPPTPRPRVYAPSDVYYRPLASD